MSAIHKLNLLPLFDEVLVFAGGRLVEQGTFAKLQEQEGEFQRLWRTFNDFNPAKAVEC